MSPLFRIPQAERFWPKVDKNGPVPVHAPELGACWLWTGHRDHDGYGSFGRGGSDGVMLKAHRWSLEQRIGRPIAPGMCALHRCDNPSCVNPLHLFEGSNADNVRDRDAKGRRIPPSGERHASAKLTEAEVRYIRSRQWPDKTQTALARRLGVAQTTVSDILHGRKWKHLSTAGEEAKDR